jgi:hypothetical protein
MTELEKQFFNEMKEIYHKAAKEINSRLTRLLQMLSEKGGVATAISLVTKPGVTEGFIRLYENQRLDLSVEALVLKDEYKELFDDTVREICANRLREYGYKKP